MSFNATTKVHTRAEKHLLTSLIVPSTTARHRFYVD